MTRCRIVLFMLFFGFLVSSLSAGNPVAFVTEIDGVWTCTDSDGSIRTLEPKSPIYNGSVVTRSSDKGYFRTIDRNGRVSPNQVESRVSFKNRLEIEPARQSAFLGSIGGSMARSGKGAGSNEFLDWMQDIGTVMEADVDAGMALVFSTGRSSAESGCFNPLVMKINPRWEVLSISYKAVQSTLVRAEGQVERTGEDWVLPLRALGGQADETLGLQLFFRMNDTRDGAIKTLALDAPFTIMASDGFIESEIRKVEDELLAGTDNPDRTMIRHMARLAVYNDYGLQLYALAERAGQ